MKKWRSFPVLVGFLFSILLTATFLNPTGTDALRSGFQMGYRLFEGQPALPDTLRGLPR